MAVLKVTKENFSEVRASEKPVLLDFYADWCGPCRMVSPLVDEIAEEHSAMPLVLASPISFAIMLLYIPLIAKRIRNEEKVLEEGLEGYKEYKTRVKNKVIPFIW